MSSTCDACTKYPVSNGRRECPTQKYYASAASVALKRSYWQHNFAGLDMSSVLIPKQAFFRQLSSGKRPQCGPVRRYKDTVKTNMKRCGLRPKSLSTAPFDRAQWRTTCQSATASFEESRVAELDRKRVGRKQQVINTTGTVWPCDRHSRTCSSRIGVGDAIRRIR